MSASPLERILAGDRVGLAYEILDDSCDRRYAGGCTFYLCFQSRQVQGIGSLIRGVVRGEVTAPDLLTVTLGIDPRLPSPPSTALARLSADGGVDGVWLSPGADNATAMRWRLRTLPEQSRHVLFDTDCFWSEQPPAGAIQAEYRNASDTCTDNFMCLGPPLDGDPLGQLQPLYGTWTWPLSASAPHSYGNCSWDYFVGITAFDNGRGYYGVYDNAAGPLTSTGYAYYRVDWASKQLRGYSCHPAQGHSYLGIYTLVPATRHIDITPKCLQYTGGYPV